MENNISINVIGSELTIREGNAPDIIVPHGRKLKIVVNSFKELFDKIKFNPASSVLLVDYEKGHIELSTNIKSTIQKGEDVFNGEVEIIADLRSFGINKEKMWQLKELGKHIKLNRHMFPDADKALILAADFMNLTATVNRKLEQRANERANVTDIYEQEVKSNIPEFFLMQCQIIKGKTKQESFKVDVNFHVSGKEVSVFLTSYELKTLTQDAITASLNDIVDHVRTSQPLLTILEV